MPIKISDSLPARAVLESENIFVMTEFHALHQDIRPLKLVILNLMPTKITTETQLLRCLSNTPVQIEIELLQLMSHKSKTTSEDHLLNFYTTFDRIQQNRYDGFIITGAPVETLEFSDVDYWDELCEIMEWSKTNVFSTFHICWGAQAGLFYHYGIQKYPLSQKMFGVFEHTVSNQHAPLCRGFNDRFWVPQSRHTELRREDIIAKPELELLSESERSGVYIVTAQGGRQIFVTGHSEYDLLTLDAEYRRDLARELPIKMPENYYPGDDPGATPRNTWRAHAHLLYSNWLNYYVYQATPYDLRTIGYA